MNATDDLLEGFRLHAPEYFSFSPKVLDEIAAGLNLEQHEMEVFDGFFIRDILPSLGWWMNVGNCIIDHVSNCRESDPMKGLLPGFRSKFTEMAIGVLNRYTALLPLVHDKDGLDDSGRQAALEMLKHYRIFTWHVRDFATAVCVDMHPSWLWNQP